MASIGIGNGCVVWIIVQSVLTIDRTGILQAVNAIAVGGRGGTGILYAINVVTVVRRECAS